MRTIAVLNQKGGVGKTTTTVNTAAALATLGMKVVVIDLDPQAHLTIHLGVEPQTIQSGSYEVLTQSAEFEESLMLIRPNLWLLGADINLVGAETELVSVVGREIILREAMLPCREQFDYCLIDCAPSLGLLSLNALAASQEVLIPLQPHFLALQGFGKLLQTVDLVNKRINCDLKVTGVLLCMFDTRASLPNEVRADIDRFLTNARGSNSAWADAQILPAFIRRNIKLAEAPSYGQTIFEYDPTCNGAADYRNVARFFMGLEPKVEGQAEPESEIAPEPETSVASAPPVEPELQEVCQDPEPTLDPAPVVEAAVTPESQEVGYGPESAGSSSSLMANEGSPESDRQREPMPGSDPIDGDEMASEPEVVSGEGRADADLAGGADPVAESDAAAELKPWSLQHTPELLLGPGSKAEPEAASESMPPEPPHAVDPMSNPEPAGAETEMGSEPKPQEASPESAPFAASEESHREPEPGSEHDAQVPQEPPRIQICEFQLPAPPLGGFPIPPAGPSEPSADPHHDEDAQRQAPERPEGQEYIGF